jgi:hypothetical protein
VEASKDEAHLTRRKEESAVTIFKLILLAMAAIVVLVAIRTFLFSRRR